MVVSYEFAGVTLRVEEPEGSKVTPSAPGGEPWGLSVWDSAVLICRMLEFDLLSLAKEGLSVIELGAGNGLPSMLLAALRRPYPGGFSVAMSAGTQAESLALVLATDYHVDVLRNMRKNLELNDLQDEVELALLDFKSPQQCSALAQRRDVPFDFVVGADLTYERDLFPYLAKTLSFLCRHGRNESRSMEKQRSMNNREGKQCKVVLAWEDRGAAYGKDFVELAVSMEGFEARELEIPKKLLWYKKKWEEESSEVQLQLSDNLHVHILTLRGQ